MEETLIIRSSEWGRGKPGGSLHKKGKYCCLGLHLRQCGIGPEQMDGYGHPSDWAAENARALPPSYEKAWLIRDDTEEVLWLDRLAAISAMKINDNPTISDEEKIEQLQPIFATRGITIDWRPEE